MQMKIQQNQSCQCRINKTQELPLILTIEIQVTPCQSTARVLIQDDIRKYIKFFTQSKFRTLKLFNQLQNQHAYQYLLFASLQLTIGEQLQGLLLLQSISIIFQKYPISQKLSLSVSRLPMLQTDNYSSLFDQAVASFKDKNLKGAVEIFTTCLELKPQSYSVLLNRGTAYLYLGSYVNALKDFNDALTIDSRDPAVYYNIAVTYLKVLNKRKALAALYCCLSCLYLQKGTISKEIKFVTKAISLVENNYYAYVQRGKLYKAQGNKMMALNDYSGAIELHDLDPQVYALRGELYYEMNQPEDAENDMKQLLLLANVSKKPVVLTPKMKSLVEPALTEEIQKRLKEVHDLRASMTIGRLNLKSEAEDNLDSKQNTDRQNSDLQNSDRDPTLRSRRESGNQKSIKDVDESDIVKEKLEKIEEEIKRFKDEKIANTSVVVTENVLEVSIPDSKASGNNSHIVQDSLEKGRREVVKGLDEESLSFKDFENHDALEDSLDRSAAPPPMGDKTVEIVNGQQEQQFPEVVTTTMQAVLNYIDEKDNKQQVFEVNSPTNSQVQITESQIATKNVVEVQIVAGVLTHDTEIFGTMSPYCRIIYGKQIKETTVLPKGGKNPVWNQMFHFKIDPQLRELKIEVYDKEFLKADDFVGGGSINILENNHKCNLKFQNQQAGIVYVKTKLV